MIKDISNKLSDLDEIESRRNMCYKSLMYSTQFLDEERQNKALKQYASIMDEYIQAQFLFLKSLRQDKNLAEKHDDITNRTKNSK